MRTIIRSYKKFTMLILLMGWTLVTTAAERCSVRVDDDQFLDKHRGLYEHALLAETGYTGEITPETCPITVDGNKQYIRLDKEKVTIVPSSEVFTDELLRRLRSDLYEEFDREIDVGFYDGDDGIPYVGCGDDMNEDTISVYVSMQRLFQKETADRRYPLFTWAVNAVVRVGRALLVDSSEEMGVVTLHRNGMKIKAFRGTDFTRMASVNTSLMDMIGKSCAFPIASLLIQADISRNDNPVSVSVVGHSLGGSISQHVAGDLGCSREYSDFSAYSFNGIGLDQTEGSNSGGLPCLHSFFIDGEFLAELGRSGGRKQAGVVTRYVPDPGTHWDRKGKFSRHKLDNVKNGLCECMQGHGKVASGEDPTSR